MTAELFDSPHRRFNPLLKEWVLCSPHRTKRPWQGQQEKPVVEKGLLHDPTCYLCPGNERAGGHKNPEYRETFVFQNDFSALLPESRHEVMDHGLLQATGVTGECRVICYSPRHDLSLGELEPSAIVSVIEAWQDQFTELGVKYPWVQIFENRGAAMGASNPHPHGQVWTTNYLPTLIQREHEAQTEFFQKHQRPMLLEVLNQEMQDETRIVTQNQDWALLVPFWAIWPFETMLMPKRHVTRMTELTLAERSSLAEILKESVARFDHLFEVPFPYSMGWHGAPTDGQDHPGWQLHAHFYPPLLRSATVRKFMVGFEMLAESQRDITAEQAAERLRALQL